MAHGHWYVVVSAVIEERSSTYCELFSGELGGGFAPQTPRPSEIVLLFVS